MSGFFNQCSSSFRIFDMLCLYFVSFCVMCTDFWGIPPDNEQALSDCMVQSLLAPSNAVKAQLEHYADIFPMNQTAFIQHFDKTWPGKFDATNAPGSGCPDVRYGCGWYNLW